MADKCNHTLYHKDRAENLQGSWTEELVVDAALGKRLRVACGVCGKFYGYGETPSKETPQGRLEPPKRQVMRDALPALPAIIPLPEEAGAGSRLMGIDYAKVRAAVSMTQVLEAVDFHATTSSGAQQRGPCPIHRSENTASRSFSVNTHKGAFRCFGCGKKGNQLDLYAAVNGLTLYDAAVELCKRFGVPLPRPEQ